MRRGRKIQGVMDSQGELCDESTRWGAEGGRKTVRCGKNIPGSENSICKGPEVEVGGLCWKNSMESSVAFMK